jgi:Family of unknown function (DUF6496)
MARRYGAKAASKLKRAIQARKARKLRSGGSGKNVPSRKQAIAIGLSAARREGAKAPRKQPRAVQLLPSRHRVETGGQRADR